jgi:hypothetical protein
VVVAVVAIAVDAAAAEAATGIRPDSLQGLNYVEGMQPPKSGGAFL